MTDDTPRDVLAEAIGRVAVAANQADMTIRTAVGDLGGPGAKLIADEELDISTVLDWCNKFVQKLHVLSDELVKEYRDRSGALRSGLSERNTIIHGTGFQDDALDTPLSVAKRKTSGKHAGSFVSQSTSVERVNQVAQDLKNAAWDFHETVGRIAYPGVFQSPSRQGQDVH